MQKPEIIIRNEFKLLGLRIKTTLSEGKTRELWQEFGPRQKEINHRMGSETYSVEIYEPDLQMTNFTPNTPFEKWAAVQVSVFEDVPKGMETLVIPDGKYAVFNFKGLHNDYPAFAQYIFGKWLPESEFELDDRPHFEVMGEKYFGPMNPESEEEIWVPIK